jgi:hypothetical protein
VEREPQHISHFFIGFKNANPMTELLIDKGAKVNICGKNDSITAVVKQLIKKTIEERPQYAHNI